MRRQVTIAGGEEPHWSGHGHGRELFYRIENRLMSVPVERAPTFLPGTPPGLFDGLYSTGVESGRSYHVNPATGRFLLVQPTDGGQSARVVRIVLNWHRLLSKP